MWLETSHDRERGLAGANFPELDNCVRRMRNITYWLWLRESRFLFLKVLARVTGRCPRQGALLAPQGPTHWDHAQTKSGVQSGKAGHKEETLQALLPVVPGGQVVQPTHPPLWW